MAKRYTVGIDFGTLSGRAVLVDTENGEVLASAVKEYAHGVMERTLPDGTPLPPQFALQYPPDYLDVLSTVVREALDKAGARREDVVGLGIDFTTCTILPIREDGTPLCTEEKYKSEPHAYVKLWKHHGAQEEADRITELARERGESWLDSYGGRVSSEWALPKIWETCKYAPEVYADAHRLIEAGDWLSLLLTGEESRAIGFAGYKYLWGNDRGYPSEDFLRAVDPRLADLIGTKIPREVRSVADRAGVLNARGAELTGLCEGVALAMPILDAHAALPALGITEPGILMAIVGTSGVQLLHAEKKVDVPGICGCVRDCVAEGLYTYEAGQTGVGDSFDWFVKNCVPESYRAAARESGMSIHAYLRSKAECLRVGESGLLALDWFNGNRCLLQNADLSGMIVGLTITTRPEEIYRAVIESTAYGVRAIVEAFASGGLTINEIRASGGIAKKDPMMMQIYADVLGRSLSVVDIDQGGAHGSAIYAAVAAGIYPTVRQAAAVMSVKSAVEYRPITENHAIYNELYAEYIRLYDYFGRGENAVMKRLRRIAGGKQ